MLERFLNRLRGNPYGDLMVDGEEKVEDEMIWQVIKIVSRAKKDWIYRGQPVKKEKFDDLAEQLIERLNRDWAYGRVYGSGWILENENFYQRLSGRFHLYFANLLARLVPDEPQAEEEFVEKASSHRLILKYLKNLIAFGGDLAGQSGDLEVGYNLSLKRLEKPEEWGDFFTQHLDFPASYLKRIAPEIGIELPQ